MTKYQRLSSDKNLPTRPDAGIKMLWLFEALDVVIL